MPILDLLWVAAALASPAQDDPIRSAFARCLAIRDDAARLACHDAAARRLVSPDGMRDVVVVDRAQVARARRSLFGLSLGDADPITGRELPAAERIDMLDTSIAAFRAESGGRWLMTLGEGGRWQTVEEWGGYGEPRRDARVTVRRGALGSYVLKMDGARAVRVRRVN